MAIFSSGDRNNETSSLRAKSRVVDGGLSQEEKRISEDSLRPQRLEDYIGQNELKQILSIAVKAAIERGEAPASLGP